MDRLAPLEVVDAFERVDGLWSHVTPSNQLPKALLGDEQKNPIEKLIDKFTWDWVIDKGASGIGSAVAGALLERLLGPNGWQSGVSSQLREIIQKLDEILDAIHKLQEFIKANDRANWRSTLEAGLASDVQMIMAALAGIKAKGGDVTGFERQKLEQATFQLEKDLRFLVNYQDPNVGYQIGLPLYAAVKSGLVQLLACQKLLGAVTATRVETAASFRPAFDRWTTFVRDYRRAKSDVIDAQVKRLSTWPRKAPISYGGPGGSEAYSPNYAVPRATLISVEISGSIDAPFTKVGDFTLQPFNTLDDAMAAFAAGPIFPEMFGPMPAISMPIMPPTNVWDIGGMVYARNNTQRMLNHLNGIRQSVIDDLNGCGELMKLENGLTDGFAAITELANS